MDYARRLRERARRGDPVRVLVIGMGKFATMFASRIPRIEGIELSAVVDLDTSRAAANMKRAGWSDADLSRVLFEHDLARAFDRALVDVVVEATGHPLAAIDHALAAFERELPVVMVTVEADALCGPALAEEARRAGVPYSLAWGDQPALICDLVDWARTNGFAVVAAGKGTKYLPAYHTSTPDTVWEHWGIDPARARAGGMNPKMYNSFLDGTKSAVEMAAVANATGLSAPHDGLLFPPAGTSRLATVLRPAEEGGVLEKKGVVEVVSSLERDGRPIPDDLRLGVYVVVEADHAYVSACLEEYGMVADPLRRYTALWRPNHLIGLELATSVASVALDGIPTGSPIAWRADVAACAKRDLEPGEELDGEGAYTVWGRLVPASRAAAERLLPIGLAHGVRLARRVEAGRLLTLDDVEELPENEAVRLRRRLVPAG
ncbi:hypothetical protein HRbin39_00143 [bacterium HR39]|nr:hypothetical protein HRbin39_00143 [bacterium HR39]